MSLDIFGLKFYVQLVKMRLLASLYGAFVGADMLQCKNNQCRVIKIRVKNQNFLSKGFSAYFAQVLTLIKACGCDWEVRDFGNKKMCFKFIGNHWIEKATGKCLDLGAAVPLPRSRGWQRNKSFETSNLE